MPAFDALWDYDHPDVTEQRFRELLPAAEQGDDRSEYAQLLTQIARTQGLQGKFTEAHATLDAVEPMLDAAMPAAAIRYLLERGRVYNSGGSAEQSVPYFQEAWELGRAAGEDDLAVDAAHMLGIVTPGSAAQLEWNLVALQLAEQSPKARRWLGSLYNNIGWTYADMGRYDQAQELFQRAIAVREEQGKPGPVRIARWCAAKMLRLLKRTPEALAVQQELEAQVRELPGEGGFVYEELGECLLELGRPEEARPHFARAYELLSGMKWLAQGEPQRLERLKALREN
jgi:tetratricopeptide (TPR) repeat protein